MSISNVEQMIDYPVFVNVMTDITGRIPLTNDDPRWIQFFNMRILVDLVCQPQILVEYCQRWSLHNISTKNFIHLLYQLNSRLKYVSKKKAGVTNTLIQECSTGLYVATIFLHHIITNLELKEVVYPVYLQFLSLHNWLPL